MRQEIDKIPTSHAGALPRPSTLPGRDAKDYKISTSELGAAVAQVVMQQSERGIRIVGDGEFGKSNFLYYVRHRLSGFSERELKEDEEHPNDAGGRRDLIRFPGYFQSRGGLYPFNNPVLFCADKIRYVGQDYIKADIANLQAALAVVGAEDGFLTAVSPCTVALTMPNSYYSSDEDYHVALAEALHDEYRAVTDAGLILQVDEPGLPGLWQQEKSWNVDRYRQSVARWVELLNFALRDCPPSLVRVHCCWGSYRGPHAGDVGLENFIDLLFRIEAECYSIEAANPRHEHEWAIFEWARLPAEKKLMPGVVSHASDTVEHPELVAQRILRYANVIGRENVIAGTDCGLRRVHPEICWAKLESLVAGAALATQRLWK
jgi:5-methyltetrahydropteroyltriglutamate--homocysteine methyltransferase